MQTLRAEDLTKTYGEKTLFKNLNFIINEHDRIGLIGTNGSGKTSLLNVISGADHDSTGNIITSKTYSIGYLKQEPVLDESLTVLDAVFAGSQDIFNTIRYYEHTLDVYSKHPDDEKAEHQYLAAESKMNEEDAWNAESDVKTILTQLKINDMNQKVSTLSGGQKRRVGLAQVLIQSPDLLILDEPTNHLDFDSIDWLQDLLAKYKGSLLFVTHDRYFLDNIANNIWELSFGKLYEYEGNYEKYVQQKAERVDFEVNAEHKKQRLYKQELAWMKKGAKARSTKQQARINRFNDLKNDVGNLQTDEDVDITLGQQRLGKKVIELKDTNLTLDNKKILDDYSLLVQPNERIGISGENGAGKSSLLNVIAGKIKPDSGVVEIGETVKMAYYTQQTETIPDDKRVIKYLTDVGENVTDNTGNKISVTDLLEQFLFPKFMHGTLIRKLSGGEKRRLYLLKLLMQQPNVLLLDEPTNDLDISTLTVLEDYIKGFAGTVITVSHDRYFLDKVSNKLLIFDGNGKIEQHVGLFTDYLASLKNDNSNKDNVKKHKKSDENKPKENNENKKTKLTYAEQIEFDGLEDEIDKLDSKSSSLQSEMQNYGDDYDKLADLQSQVDDLNKQSNQKMQRWEYLSQFAE
ncbi:ABC-F family ATP-binding cassette domain-containing protein [Apilactobacillus timberlakei]|uniref:ABC transporter ATP-binding protein n=1 Tax=Apilactobacillus timberlakei TaxID=2008380 RepID=A0ABY2YYP6_9LACO|nr:ABC-F family ATP-binding cassette domain-containing protein [Apilactobacillus timberlakei]TPR13895.1 ABC transporter ATP-binding protein [Apilactobacillus timberlakei]TPR15211.1 ABC transporter ATP-binding protein [Apilactobacillus timberlakei]TPR17102.1 ABC transporter ATP-binding protein [Apilactobacillus timberlakei]